MMYSLFAPSKSENERASQASPAEAFKAVKNNRRQMLHTLDFAIMNLKQFDISVLKC